MTGKLIEYPFDTVKTRLQSQPPEYKLFKGPLDCFRQTLNHEGFLGLFRVNKFMMFLLVLSFLFPNF
jgi:ornithine carrier protein